MPILRGGAPDGERRALLRAALENAIWSKPKQHSFEEPEHITEKCRMSGIGG